MDELEYIKKLAGINEFTGYSEYQVNENPSETATELKKKEKDLGIKPGDDEWFKLWFSKPYMTGVPKFRGRK
jgi:hypothetical protein